MIALGRFRSIRGHSTWRHSIWWQIAAWVVCPWAASISGCEANAIGVLPCESSEDCRDDPACSGSMCSPPPSGELVKYTFDTGLQGWALDDFADPANLGYLVPDGIPEPTLVFSATEGEPGLGALVVSATFAGH